jgi:acyl-CoA synthetase (AMP-forming)/AMP-acid ligase II
MGYLDMEKQTIDAFGGPDTKYFRTGDLGRQDARGFLYVCGRMKGEVGQSRLPVVSSLLDHRRN